MQVAATDELGCDLTFLNGVYVPLLIEDWEEYSYTNHRIWRQIRTDMRRHFREPL